MQQLGATDAVGAGAQRGVCGLGRRVAHAGARLLEPPWVRGWYQNVRLLEAVILGVERPLRGAASRTTAGGDDPRSKRALCLLAMDDRRGYLS